MRDFLYICVMEEYHYTYHIIDPITGQFYYGSRTCKGVTPQDDKYMGSMCVWKPEDKSRLKKTILREFTTREEATLYEIELIKLYIKDDLNENYHIPTVGFSTQGKVFSEEEINANRKRQTEKSGVKCFLYELYTDNVYEFLSKRDCGRFLNERSIVNSRVRENKTFIDGEFLYTTEKITQNHKIHLIKNSKQVELKVVQIDKTLNVVNTFDSLRDAMRKFGNSLSSVVNNKTLHKSMYGFHWLYLIDFILMSKEELTTHLQIKFKVIDFTSEDIEFIRNPLPKLTIKQLCEKFNCSKGTIDNVRSRKGRYSKM
jgi:hypothetical protein